MEVDHPAASAYEPAYATVRDDGSVSKGCTCADNPDRYCYICRTEASPETAGTPDDLRQAFIDMINVLCRSNKDIHYIIECAYERYEEEIRPLVKDSKFGEAPEYTRDAIYDHLVHGTQFPAMAGIIISKVYKSIVHTLNNTMIDAASGCVIPEHQLGFTNAVTGLIKWERHVHWMKTQSNLG